MNLKASTISISLGFAVQRETCSLTILILICDNFIFYSVRTQETALQSPKLSAGAIKPSPTREIQRIDQPWS